MPWKKKPFGWGKAFSGEALFPAVQGATVAVLNQVKDLVREDASIRGITFKVNTLEPPSVELAIQSMLDEAKSSLDFECVASSIPKPDPRESFAKRPLWKFSGNKSAAAVPKPDDGLMNRVADVVRSSRDCLESWTCAKERSTEFTVDQVEPLLSVMVFPPPNPSDLEATQWVRRTQLAAAQLATNVEKFHGVSIADSKVGDVINGPLDWIVDSAMVALAQRAKEEDELIDEVRSIVQRVATRVPSDGTWSCSTVAKSVLKYLDLAAEPSSSVTARSSSNR